MFLTTWLSLFSSGFPCKICPPGSYNNVTRAETCYCCKSGYSSTYMKTSCRACPANEYADQGDFPNCTLCRTCFTKASCKLHEMCCRHFSTIHTKSSVCVDNTICTEVVFLNNTLLIRDALKSSKPHAKKMR